MFMLVQSSLILYWSMDNANRAIFELLPTKQIKSPSSLEESNGNLFKLMLADDLPSKYLSSIIIDQTHAE